jgi:hypothetical protein
LFPDLVIRGRNAFSEASKRRSQNEAHTTHNDTHTTPSMMSSDAALTAVTAAIGGVAIATTPASPTDAQEAIPSLPDHLVVALILRSEHFDDPADIARLQAVSRAMRDAVAAMGLRFEELSDWEAVQLGCLSALERRQRQGRLSRRELLCETAARGGQLEKLKVLSADGCPWNEETCTEAARGGYLKVLQWAQANGCPWNEQTCTEAA